MSTAAVLKLVDQGHYQITKDGKTVCRVDGETMPCKRLLRARSLPQGNLLVEKAPAKS